MYDLPLFKDTGYKYEPEIYNGCHDISITAYEVENIATRNIKGIDYGVIWNMTRNDAIYRLDNSKLNDKGPLQI